MVRKSAPHNQARQGIIPSNDPCKDRARTTHMLLKAFVGRMTDDNKKLKLIADKAAEILEIGCSDGFFNGRNPYVSGIAVFVAVSRHFTYNKKCPATYDEIREKYGPFSSGQSFVTLVNKITTEFRL